MIGRSGERWSGISVLVARHDDDDVIYIRGLLNKFPNFFRTGTFIDSTHMKL